MAGREISTGATEEEAAAILQAEKEVLVRSAQEEKMATLLKPLLRDVALLEGRKQDAQLERLRAERSIEHTQWQIEQRARDEARRAEAARTEADRAAIRAEQDRLRGIEVEKIRQQAIPGLENLSRSYSHIDQGIGMRIVEIFDTPGLATFLPDALEGSVDSIAQASNDRRFKIATEDDSLRLAFFKDETYALVYNPKPGTPELQLATELAGSMNESGFTVNPHIFGIHINPFGDKTPFFVETREATAGDGVGATKGIIDAPRFDSAPLLDRMNRILNDGNIEPPKKFAKPAPSKPQRRRL